MGRKHRQGKTKEDKKSRITIKSRTITRQSREVRAGSRGSCVETSECHNDQSPEEGT